VYVYVCPADVEWPLPATRIEGVLAVGSSPSVDVVEGMRFDVGSAASFYVDAEGFDSAWIDDDLVIIRMGEIELVSVSPLRGIPRCGEAVACHRASRSRRFGRRLRAGGVFPT
jgi:hypothetical protein